MATYTGIVQSIAVRAWEQTFAGLPHPFLIRADIQTTFFRLASDSEEAAYQL